MNFDENKIEEIAKENLRMIGERYDNGTRTIDEEFDLSEDE